MGKYQRSDLRVNGCIILDLFFRNCLSLFSI